MAKNNGPRVWRRATIAGRYSRSEIDEFCDGRIPFLFWEHVNRRADEEFHPYSLTYWRGFRRAFWED